MQPKFSEFVSQPSPKHHQSGSIDPIENSMATPIPWSLPRIVKCKTGLRASSGTWEGKAVSWYYFSEKFKWQHHASAGVVTNFGGRSPRAGGRPVLLNMPIYQRRVYSVVKPPKDVNDGDKLFTIAHTGEQFKDERSVFCCTSTFIAHGFTHFNIYGDKLSAVILLTLT